MRRVVILGPGASGKSTLAGSLGALTGLPVVELDKVFWQPGLVATPREQWAEMQQTLIGQDGWILDGDLGPYDAVEVRLQAADTIVFLDFPLVRCAWRAVHRSGERADFWLWLLRYRQQSRPLILEAMARHAPHAMIHTLSNPKAVGRFLAEIARGQEEPVPDP